MDGIEFEYWSSSRNTLMLLYARLSHRAWHPRTAEGSTGLLHGRSHVCRDLCTEIFIAEGRRYTLCATHMHVHVHVYCPLMCCRMHSVYYMHDMHIHLCYPTD